MYFRRKKKDLKVWFSSVKKFLSHAIQKQSSFVHDGVNISDTGVSFNKRGSVGLPRTAIGFSGTAFWFCGEIPGRDQRDGEGNDSHQRKGDRTGITSQNK